MVMRDPKGYQRVEKDHKERKVWRTRRSCHKKVAKEVSMKTHTDQREPGKTQIEGKRLCGWEVGSLGGLE